MAFDINMIKQVYSRLSERVAAARKLTGRPLTATEKTSILTFGKIREIVHSKGVLIMLTLLQTELRVKMRLLKWHYYNSCSLENLK